jgi:hypothetical protein
MDTIDLSAYNNTPFAFFPNVTTWDQLFDLSLGIIRMQMRKTPSDVNVVHEWSTANGKIIVAPITASGTIAFLQNPANNEAITIGTTAVTFKTSGATGDQVNIGDSLTDTLASLLQFLQASSDGQLSQCSYEVFNQTLMISFKVDDVAGNNFTLSTTVAEATASSTTLTGGGAQLQITAPIADIADFVGSYSYDCRYEGLFSTALMFGGTITFEQGITQTWPR